MSNHEVDFAGEVLGLVQADNDAVHGSGTAEDPELVGGFWFT